MATRTVRESDYLSVSEMAASLNVERRTIVKWITDGRLPAIRPGNAFRVKRDDFEHLLRESETRRSA